MTGLLLILFLLLIGRIAFVRFRPQRSCRWCEGKGTWHGRRCWRCTGDGHVWRLGARLAHRAHLAAIRAWQEWREGE